MTTSVIVPPPPELRVFHFNRTAGCHPMLVSFFAWWQQHGPFPITIPEDGGIRTEMQQAAAFAAGRSKAKTLATTPHGRGGAVDAWPAKLARRNDGSVYVAGIVLPTEPGAREKFNQFGSLAEAHALQWLGRAVEIFPPSQDNPLGGDLPHVQVPHWQDLPFPPLSHD